MAEGFARRFAEELGLDVEIASAGTRPEGFVHPQAVEVMREAGIDISHQRSKGVRPEELLEYDIVITMGCSKQDILPAGFRGEARDWAIEDPFGRPIDVYRRMREEIRKRVLELLHKETR
jgi:protein-tyrosine-phosphatase